MKASGGLLPARASEPAVVGIPVVSMLSFTITGMPSSGRRSPSLRRDRSAARTSVRAVRLTVITAWSFGFSRLMRTRRPIEPSP